MMLPTDLNINDKIKVMYRQMKKIQKFVCNPLEKNMLFRTSQTSKLTTFNNA